MIRTLFVIVIAAVLGSCAAAEKEYLITIKTDFGDMHAVLYDETPEHKKNFIKLAKEGYYDSMLFHRVIKQFMIQGGDPNSKNAQPRQPLGSGGPGHTVPAEFNEKYYHKKGAFSAARQPDHVNPEKRSSGSQFYIVQGKTWTEEELTIDMDKLNKSLRALLMRTDYANEREELQRLFDNEEYEAYEKKLVELRDDIETVLNIDISKEISPEKLEAYSTIGGSPHLDGEYTVFGEVIDGLHIIDSIANKETYQMGRGNPLNDRPIEDIRFFVDVEELSKKKIEKLYNYTFPVTEEK